MTQTSVETVTSRGNREHLVGGSSTGRGAPDTATNMATLVTSKPTKTQPKMTSWASWSTGMSYLSDESGEHHQFESAFANTNLESICALDIDAEPFSYRMTQIICTIGPACQDAELLMKMALSGEAMALHWTIPTPIQRLSSVSETPPPT